MSRINDLTGLKIGKLTVIEIDYDVMKKRESDGKRRRLYWRCKCDCGNEKSIETSSLTSKNPTVSCGCEQKNVFKKLYLNKANKGDSVAHKLVEIYGSDALEKYWDYEMNQVSPYDINANTNKTIYIKCNKTEYHGSYKITGNNLFNSSNNGCPYCNRNSGKVHKCDSIGYKYSECVKYWSDKNEKSPYEYSEYSHKYVWFKCHNGKHDDYKRIVSTCSKSNFMCPQCSNTSRGEFIVAKVLSDNNVDFIKNKWYKHLVGVGGKRLSYDFYIKKFNTLIEFNGTYHDGSANRQTESQLKIQQEHDMRKRDYANKNNIKLIEIWYWDRDNVEEILKNEGIIK